MNSSFFAQNLTPNKKPLSLNILRVIIFQLWKYVKFCNTTKLQTKQKRPWGTTQNFVIYVPHGMQAFMHWAFMHTLQTGKPFAMQCIQNCCFGPSSSSTSTSSYFSFCCSKTVNDETPLSSASVHAGWQAGKAKMNAFIQWW